MTVTLPIIGRNAQIGEIHIEDKKPEERINRPRAKVAGTGLIRVDHVEFEDHWYKLERLTVRLDKDKINGAVYSGREARLQIYVHEDFLAEHGPKRMEALDHFIWGVAGAWIFSYAQKFDTRGQLERWKP